MSLELLEKPEQSGLPVQPSEPLPEEINAWRKRLEGIGLQVLSVAYEALASWGSREFQGKDEPDQKQLTALWQDLKQRLSEQQPVALNRENNNLVIAYLMSIQGEQKSIIGCQISPPYNEKTLQLIQLSLGWLQSAIYADAARQGAQATYLMELMGYVLSQKNARIAAQEWIRLTNNLVDRVLSSSNLFLLWFTYPVVKGIHEWAHGMAVKAWGGNVREMGLMFILFVPVPYVNASASYHFPSKWTCAMVSAAGIAAELLVGALATYVWLQVESELIHAIAFNIILIAGVSTLLVNGNPLMRYDGYFILSDLVEIPNLAQRSTQ